MITNLIRKNLIVSFSIGIFSLFFLLTFAASVYENSNRLMIDEDGRVICKASGKFKDIVKPTCLLMAQLQGRFFWNTQKKLVISQLQYRENEFVPQSIAEIEELKRLMTEQITAKQNLYRDLLSKEAYEIEKIRLVSKKYPKDIDQQEKLETALRRYSMMTDNQNAELKKITETFSMKISALQHEIDLNPTYIISLKKRLIAIEKNL